MGKYKRIAIQPLELAPLNVCGRLWKLSRVQLCYFQCEFNGNIMQRVGFGLCTVNYTFFTCAWLTSFSHPVHLPAFLKTEGPWILTQVCPKNLALCQVASLVTTAVKTPDFDLADVRLHRPVPCQPFNGLCRQCSQHSLTAALVYENWQQPSSVSSHFKECCELFRCFMAAALRLEIIVARVTTFCHFWADAVEILPRHLTNQPKNQVDRLAACTKNVCPPNFLGLRSSSRHTIVFTSI